jgi:uncharacterized protein YbbK (DUF523 family)
MVRPRVGISRCLLGDEVRYDGGHKLEPSLIERLADRVEWVPVCPEVEVGMGVPREPIELVVMPAGAIAASAVRVVGCHTGDDWTARMQAWAARRISELAELRLSGFVLKARSPSCGVRDVAVRGGDAAAGLFAQALLTAMPDLPVDDEERLRDPAARARFLERVLARHDAG